MNSRFTRPLTYILQHLEIKPSWKHSDLGESGSWRESRLSFHIVIFSTLLTSVFQSTYFCPFIKNWFFLTEQFRSIVQTYDNYPETVRNSWRRKWQPTPVFLPGKSHGQRSLVDYTPRGSRVGHDWATSLNAFSMIQRMLAIWSLVPLPFLKPAWTSGSSWFMYCWSLAWRILSITLLACEVSAIVQ